MEGKTEHSVTPDKDNNKMKMKMELKSEQSHSKQIYGITIEHEDGRKAEHCHSQQR